MGSIASEIMVAWQSKYRAEVGKLYQEHNTWRGFNRSLKTN
jgi:hypothetical protein